MKKLIFDIVSALSILTLLLILTLVIAKFVINNINIGISINDTPYNYSQFQLLTELCNRTGVICIIE